MTDELIRETQLDQELKHLQVANLEADLRLKNPPLWKVFSTNPVVVAAVITAIVSLAASYVSLTSAREQRDLDERKATTQLQYEFVKSEFDFVLQALRAANPDEAAENLTFLLETGIIQRTAFQERLSKYLKDRKPARGPFFPNNGK